MSKSTISAIDAIKNHYISEILLKELFVNITFKSTKKIENKLINLVNKANHLNERELLKYMYSYGYAVKYDNYINSNWVLKEIDLNDCGVWPLMGGLPESFTNGSVVDTANTIKPYLEDKNKLNHSLSRLLYIENLIPYAEIITKHIPLNVFTGSIIRRNKLMIPKYITDTKDCKYDIEDGNHRAVAMALKGKTKIKAFIGTRIYKNPYVYY